jgi:hypothetical protein
MMRNTILLIAFLLFILSPYKSSAQCCAAGNPISGDGSASGTSKNVMEVSLYYQHSYSDTYFDGTQKTDYKYIDYSFFDYTSLRLAYGISNRIKVSAELGYFFSKAQVFDFGYDRKAYGIGDLVLGVQYMAYRNGPRSFEVYPSFHITLPVGTFDQLIGVVVLPIDLQPSSGSFKYKAGVLLSKRYLQNKLAFFIDGSMEISQRINTDRTNYKYGNLYNLSLYGSYKIVKRLTGAIQTRCQIRDKASDSNKETLQSTGGYFMFVSPQLRYNFWRSWNISAVFEYPFYKNPNGKQLTNKYAYSFRLSRAINFTRKRTDLIDKMEL